jgi:hypothetical protein
MRLRRCLKETTKPSSSTTAKPRLAADPGTRNSSLSKETRIREAEVYEVYFGSAPKETGVNNDYGFRFRLLPHISARCHSTGLQDDQF